MLRTSTRLLVFSLGIAGLAVGTAPDARGQAEDLKQYRVDPASPMPGDALSKLRDMRESKLRVTGPDFEKNKALFKQVAQNYVYKVTYAQYYTNLDSGELSAKVPQQTLEYEFNDLQDKLLIPTASSRLTSEHAEYIKEFGIALDQAVRDVFKKNPPPVIRVNAARALAIVSRSGAPVHAKTIQEMLTNKFFMVSGKPIPTYPEVLLYALRAAEGLLAAYDPVAHFLAGAPPRHSLKEKELVELVQVLDDLVVKGPDVAHLAAPVDPDQSVSEKTQVAPKTDGKAPAAEPKEAPAAAPAPPPPAGKLVATQLTSEQAALVRFYRRAAVQALSKVRFSAIGGEAGIPLVRPAFTLARIAVSDVSLPMPSSTPEVVEAVIGLVGMVPSDTLNQQEWLYTIAVGTYLTASARTSEVAANKTTPALPWRSTAARMTVALDGLKSATLKNPRLKVNERPIQDLIGVLNNSVLAPLERSDAAVGAGVNLDALNTWLQSNVPADRRLFTEGAPSQLQPRPLGGQ